MKVAFAPEPLLNCQKLSYMGLDTADCKPDERPDIMFNWNWTGTVWDPIETDSPNVINRYCLNTSKSYVDMIFSQVYGYSSAAQGPIAVEKPDHTNGFKDCRIVNGADRKPGCFYQIPFIDTYYPQTRLTEYRITVMDFRPVIVLVKLKTVSMDNLIGKVDSYTFDHEADMKIWEFCEAYPLEYGELDGVYFGGKFYIYDVNPTPGDAAFHNMPEKQSKYYQNVYKHHLYKWLTRLT